MSDSVAGPMNAAAPDRRHVVLGGLGALGAAALAHGCGERSAAHGAPTADPGIILVLLELYGGVDGLTTVVPFASDEYHRARPTSRVDPARVLRLNDAVGLHPALWRLRSRHDRGELALIQGCGYPEPIYSHFRSMEVWHTARRAGRASGDGWIGRLRRAAWPSDEREALVVHIGRELPWSLVSSDSVPLFFTSARNFRPVGRAREQLAVDLSAQASPERAGASSSPRERLLASMKETHAASSTSSNRVQAALARFDGVGEYPDASVGEELRTIAAMIAAGFETRVYSLAHGNYDTHGGTQGAIYQMLHDELDRALDAFLTDVSRTARGKDVVVLAFSEFGRRFHENESLGTDHGAAGPMFLVGPRVRGGILGEHPSLREPDADDNLVHTTDFRRVYASVLAQGFGIRPESVLADRFEPLPLLV